jgi:hypothetical protein
MKILGQGVRNFTKTSQLKSKRSFSACRTESTVIVVVAVVTLMSRLEYAVFPTLSEFKSMSPVGACGQLLLLSYQY